MTVTTEITRAEFEARLVKFLDALQAWQTAYYAKNYPVLSAPTFTAERGTKYIRIVSNGRAQRSSYCFLDFQGNIYHFQGNIYRCDGWKKPAKHIRGSIFSDDFDLGRGLTTYGAAYLK